MFVCIDPSPGVHLPWTRSLRSPGGLKHDSVGAFSQGVRFTKNTLSDAALLLNNPVSPDYFLLWAPLVSVPWADEPPVTPRGVCVGDGLATLGPPFQSATFFQALSSLEPTRGLGPFFALKP